MSIALRELCYSTSSIMPFLAEEHIDIPSRDLLSWIFDEQPYDEEKPVCVQPLSHTVEFYRKLRHSANVFHQIYVDASEPSRTICSRQARSLVRRLAAGFKVAGIRKGDCVCILSFNDVRHFPSSYLNCPPPSFPQSPSHTTLCRRLQRFLLVECSL